MDEVLFRLYDPDPSSKGLHVITEDANHSLYDKASLFNKEKWGIFWCPNMRRVPNEQGTIERKSHLVQDSDIRAWFCDIDGGTHQEQWERICKIPASVAASMIVKSKNGFHLYWFTNEPTVENFSMIENRIINFLDADKKAKDLVRLLRFPSYYHWKDPNDPFRITAFHKNTLIKYTENQMLAAFPMPPEEKMARQLSDQKICERFSADKTRGQSAYYFIKNMNQKELLERLSGTEYVNGEVYTFSETWNGHYNMSVNGKSVGCFINEKGEIVADTFYGNNIINWLKWPEYRHDMKDIYTILTNIVPEVFY